MLTQMEKHLQHSAFSAKLPLSSEMVQLVPGTTSSVSRCVEPWEFKVLLHRLWPHRVSLALLLVLSFPEVTDNRCFPSTQLDLITYSGGKKCPPLASSLHLSAVTCITDRRGRLRGDFKVGIFSLHANSFLSGLFPAQEVCLHWLLSLVSGNESAV